VVKMDLTKDVNHGNEAKGEAVHPAPRSLSRPPPTNDSSSLERGRGMSATMPSSPPPNYSEQFDDEDDDEGFEAQSLAGHTSPKFFRDDEQRSATVPKQPASTACAPALPNTTPEHSMHVLFTSEQDIVDTQARSREALVKRSVDTRDSPEPPAKKVLSTHVGAPPSRPSVTRSINQSRSSSLPPGLASTSSSLAPPLTLRSSTSTFTTTHPVPAAPRSSAPSSSAAHASKLPLPPVPSTITSTLGVPATPAAPCSVITPSAPPRAKISNLASPLAASTASIPVYRDQTFSVTTITLTTEQVLYIYSVCDQEWRE